MCQWRSGGWITAYNDAPARVAASVASSAVACSSPPWSARNPNRDRSAQRSSTPALARRPEKLTRRRYSARTTRSRGGDGRAQWRTLLVPHTEETSMADLPAHEQDQIDQANSSGKPPVVFVHGLWLLPSSWDRWRELFENAG